MEFPPDLDFSLFGGEVNFVKIFIDADPIVYRCGFAAEKITRRVVYSPHGSEDICELYFEPDGDGSAYFHYKNWLEAFDEHEEPVVLEYDSIVDPEALDHVLSTVKAVMNEIIYSTASHFKLNVKEIEYHVLLSGPGNFRNDIATIKEYKGNRKEDYKPYWYQQIRNYLTTNWNGEVIEGREADDECSIRQRESGCTGVIATIDKDLDQVPGWHYNYMRKTFYEVGADEAELLFYKQVLSGDPTDNIPGCYKIGTGRANSIIDAVYTEHGLDHKRIWETIIQTYDHSLETYGKDCVYYNKAHEEGIEAVVLETARLVKMQEYQGQLWTPPWMDDEQLDVGFEG